MAVCPLSSKDPVAPSFPGLTPPSCLFVSLLCICPSSDGVLSKVLIRVFILLSLLAYCMTVSIHQYPLSCRPVSWGPDTYSLFSCASPFKCKLFGPQLTSFPFIMALTPAPSIMDPNSPPALHSQFPICLGSSLGHTPSSLGSRVLPRCTTSSRDFPVDGMAVAPLDCLGHNLHNCMGSADILLSYYQQSITKYV